MLGVFIDLKKTFDRVNYEILLHKLKLCGIKGACLEWFKSYLSNQNQYIINNACNNIQKSVYLDILCGVPEGSILGPLLFLIYVDDHCKCSEKLNPIMFPDDNILFLPGLNVNDIFSNMNCELSKKYPWFKANKLLLNLPKKTYSLLHPASKKKIFKGTTIILENG